MAESISAHLITHQCVTLDFCVESTIRSMLDFCDDIYINDGKSTDGTLDILYSLQNEYGRDRIKLFEREWQHNRRMWADEKNFILDKIPQDSYVLCIDADEALHEKDIHKLKELTSKGFKSISFNVIHFYGRPTNFIEGPNWYKSHTRLWKRSTGIKLICRPGGCADDVVWPNGQPAHIINHQPSGISIYHYGNCRDPKALGMKAKKADDLYQNSDEYKGGLLAKPRAFTYAFDSIKTQVFKGTHPKYVKEWCKIHNNQPTEYLVEGEQQNKLWCFEE